MTDVYPMVGMSYYFWNEGGYFQWRGIVIVSADEVRYTQACDSEEEADREAQKLLERLRG
jgi:hypothetical protein